MNPIKFFRRLAIILIIISSGFLKADEPYTIQLEQVNIPGSPKIHSFAFADDGKWLFIGGRINGMHGFDAATAFPKQFSNTNIFVVDPIQLHTLSRVLFFLLYSSGVTSRTKCFVDLF